ncbi:PadR family transcriptional regulator [Staphylococcus equorum]|uniref:PadR family transcriptional regulator n=1 Tax=Staphylococcus equorum TaxID=246432 RepID=A0A9X4L4X1_9STAP|nr:PadR family transcriptional regulator [Staphylococcus equorum]ALM55814.1 hypothetical protein SE1039_00310 [Staphylococcus equorum]MDG0819752.1 PadR family transcriptional regulator [Staphylococcus equorum]MDG0840393.1 PadR family transcriptional regulator [Staphylococcus equorum]MDG0846076.1 PadR family transcriptional regulator [Staphylococcus equorum]
MAQKNILQYILLGLLKNQSLSGYDIKKSFEKDIGEFWQAKHSQIYPQLKTLNERALIDKEIIIAGEKLEKKVYFITDKGLKILNEWIVSPTPELSVSKNEFHLKLFFISDKNDPILPVMFQEQIQLHKSKLINLKERRTILFGNKYNREENYGQYLVLDYAIQREENHIEWLNDRYYYFG